MSSNKRPATDYRYNISHITKRPTTSQVKRISKREPHTQPTHHTQPTPPVPPVPTVPPLRETIATMLNEVSGDVNFEIDPPSTHRVFEPLSSESESDDDSDWEP
jgi:hypothetical protein